MSRLAPKSEVLRALFARSGNQCAFPGCTQQLVNHKNKFIAQVCHIEAASEGGERYNSDSDDEYRRSYENLVIFCYPHHIETDDIDEYSTEILHRIKRNHEQQFLKSDFKLDESELMRLSVEMETYWSKIAHLNKSKHIYIDSGLAMEVDGQSDFSKLISDAYEAVDGIEGLLNHFDCSDQNLMADFERLLGKKGINLEEFSDIPYYENPFENKNWEYHNLGSPNWLKRMRITLTHIEVKYLGEYLKTNSTDLVAKDKLEASKLILQEYARTAIHVD